MRGLAHIVTVGSCVVMAAAASAREVQLGLDTTLQAESNLLRTPTAEQPDGILRLAPLLSVSDYTDKVTYRLFYQPTFEQFFDLTELSGWNHYLSARGNYAFGPRTEVEMQGSFIQGRTRNLAATDVTDISPDEAVDADELRRRSLRASLSLNHGFSARLKGRLDADFQYYLFSGGTGADNRSLGGTGSLDYSLSSRTQTGLGAAVIQQVFDGTTVQPESHTTVARVFAIFGHAFDPTFSFNLQAGPIVLSSEQVGGITDVVLRPKYRAGFVDVGPPGIPMLELRASGPGLPPGNPSQCATVAPFPGPRAQDCNVNLASPGISLDEALTQVFVPYVPGWQAAGPTQRKVTYFAVANLSKQWNRANARLSYERRESASSVEGASTILDSVTLVGQLLASERWTLGVIGLWFRRTSSSTTRSGIETVMQDNPLTGYAEAVNVIAAPQSNSLNVTQYRASVWARFQLAKRVALRSSFEYNTQTWQGLNDRKTQNYLAFLRLEYRFDPFSF